MTHEEIPSLLSWSEVRRYDPSTTKATVAADPASTIFVGLENALQGSRQN
jgi:hypothetical protein